MQPKILPVVDLKRGQVVHGVAGQRDSYEAIESCIVSSPHPAKVAKAMCATVACNDLYLADLDAITGGEPDWNAYELIRQQGLSVWLDAGVSEISQIQKILSKLPCRIIVALETLPRLSCLGDLVDGLRGRLVFSLDLKAGIPQTNDRAGKRLSAETIAAYAVDAGVNSMIVLDTAAVGTQVGAATADLCRRIRSRYHQIELVSGGGVRDRSDVERFVDAGCDRVLVATAIHRGQLAATAIAEGDDRETR